MRELPVAAATERMHDHEMPEHVLGSYVGVIAIGRSRRNLVLMLVDDLQQPQHLPFQQVLDYEQLAYHQHSVEQSQQDV